MRHLRILAIVSLLTLVSTFSARLESASADDAFSGKPIFAVKVLEGGQVYNYLLDGVSRCDIGGTSFVCATYTDTGWMESKRVSINPAMIIAVAEFSSRADYDASLKKVQATTTAAH